jgi:Trypsin-like peptidase domain
MRTRLLLCVLVLMSLAGRSRAENFDDSLLAYAVNVHRTPMQTWGPGYGIYLGKGLFITAAHVVGRAWMTRPKVVIAGQEYPTNVVKEGSFEGTDLTLLSIDESLLPMRLRLRQNALCKEPTRPGQDVVTVIPEAVVHSHILAPARIPISVRRFSTAIADVAQTGNSGSGVFDAEHRCLLGIMSRKISQMRVEPRTGRRETYDMAKYFVPASEIAAFMPANVSLRLR